MPDDGRSFRPDRRPWPADVARDVDEEIAAHLDEQRQALTDAGLPPDRAAAEAARRFGNREDVADACRQIDRQHQQRRRRAAMLTDLWQDLTYALRLFRRSPAFTAVAIGTLAVGMGATTTIFTLANWALLRPVPGVTAPEHVSVIWIGRTNNERSFTVARISYPNLADAASRLRSISIGGYQNSGSVAIAGGGQAARNVGAQYVTASYFDVLGVRMQIGRPFTTAEDMPPAPFLGAVISDRLWQSMFQRKPDVLQETLDVAGVKFAILGVAPPAFHGTERLSMTDLWLPGASTPIVRRFTSGAGYDSRARGAYYELVARLTPGATWPQAQAELDSFRAWLGTEYPQGNDDGFRRMGFRIMGPIGPPPMARNSIKTIVGLTAGGASALVMLIACANVAGLLMIRGIARRGEIGVRNALGASRWRLIRQQLAEGTLLWLLGGAAALVPLVILRETVDVGALIGLGGVGVTPPIDWRVLAFAGLVSLVVGVLASIGPALRATRVDAAETLRASLPTATRRMFVGTSLAVFQLAASLTLLIGAFLLVGTLRHLARVPLGFDPAGLYVLQLRPQTIGYNDAQSLAYVEAFQQRLRLARDVRAVAVAQAVPFAGGAVGTRVRRADADPESRPLETDSTSIFSPEYFSTLSIPIVKGRTFTDSEFAAARRGEPGPVIVSDRLAQRLFGDENPLGRELTFSVTGSGGHRAIVGVVGTVRFSTLVSEPNDMIYMPAGARAASLDAILVARTGGSAAIAEDARRIAADLNPSLPLTGVHAMTEAVGRARSEWDSLARLLWILAATAAVLACVGLYGVIGHGVAQRRREFGIRLALGASPPDVWRLVLRRTATITAAGVVLGLFGGYAFAQVLSARLVGVNPLDPRWWTLATVSLVAVAVLASLRPALVATRVDVSETLRAQ